MHKDLVESVLEVRHAILQGVPLGVICWLLGYCIWVLWRA
jgi:hypothetical protein